MTTTKLYLLAPVPTPLQLERVNPGSVLRTRKLSNRFFPTAVYEYIYIKRETIARHDLRFQPQFQPMEQCPDCLDIECISAYFVDGEHRFYCHACHTHYYVRYHEEEE